MASYEKFIRIGIALDPIHVGTGGARIGRVDLTIVRDPVTQVPKIPGSSLAGVYRTYVAMHYEDQRQQQIQQASQSGQQASQSGQQASQSGQQASQSGQQASQSGQQASQSGQQASQSGQQASQSGQQASQSGQQASQSGQQFQGRQKPYYPDCAGLGLDANRGHCRQPDCPVCTVFGFASGAGQGGGFAGLAAFTDAHVLLFPVPTRQGPMWVSCPMVLRLVGLEVKGVEDNAVYLQSGSNNQTNNQTNNQINLGWLLLPVKTCAQMNTITSQLQKSWGIPDYICNRLALVPDRLFAHIVNSNLEVRTSVSIDPATGAAEEGALFSYEALPRGTVLVWEIIAKNPAHFKIGGTPITLGAAQAPTAPAGAAQAPTASAGAAQAPTAPAGAAQAPTAPAGATQAPTASAGAAQASTVSAVANPADVHDVTKQAHPYLEHLGIGGMGTRGMGRVKVIHANQSPSNQTSNQTVQCNSAAAGQTTSSTSQGGGQP
ncbi:RAMP superfamily CRISPR-associated protein [Roseiflexus sp.]|uniref:RAMP superfamily CRISPR-associated protein n=1 Tax=Roseiflexus sp. TaxID=2562120 RepID=UPI0021DCA2BD|nr:RAMP superfamily CRISPR-associated protein [Roseiflexus sp.]GIV98625.1 MAG: hypothetical protein KatS3mg058_0029 [Roseiflexus sp.]